ncbi:hypothetical protein GCM10022247_48470 [Allokutzneria multivorans]|uniref:Deoxyxylulose-5-phosphate synthase n=1 Tax=Allokutzneria multivorans TaxID=1142134 RepID=A0ABP7T055_9PSEU
MCVYAFAHYKLHFVCTECRVSFKRHFPEQGRQHLCPTCAEPMRCAGHDFAAPSRRDTRAWSVVRAVVDEGLRYEGFEPCGCGKDPKYRPRTRADLRARRAVARREGISLAEALARRDAHIAER